MADCRQVNFFSSPTRLAIIAFLMLLIASCTVPRRYQKNKPFVYKSTISVKADMPPSERKALRSRLYQQLDDSLKAQTVLALYWKPPFFYKRLARPPLFDSLYIGRSRTFMTGLLNAEGYFHPQILDSYRIDTVRDQQRVSVHFDVTPGKALRLDSVGYAFSDSVLQRMALAGAGEARIRKGDTYSIPGIAAELERLLGIFRDNGYYRLSREDLYAEHDTVVAALIDPGLNPFEQFQLLDSLSRRDAEPTITVVFKQRQPKDSSHLRIYHWGHVKVYPDRPRRPGPGGTEPDSVRVGAYTFYPESERFKLPFVARNIAIRPGTIYRQRDYFQTTNTFTNLGAWQQVDIDITERPDSSGILDTEIHLYPAKKKSLNIDFETSRNAMDVLTTSSLFGLGLNMGVRNRNAFRESVATSTNVRLGVELGPNIVQTVQASFGHNIYIPRFVTPFRVGGMDGISGQRTILNFNTAYTQRRQFFDVRSINTSWGYDWTKNNVSWQYIPFNFEFSSVNKAQRWLDLEAQVPSLAQAFNNGLIIGQVLAMSRARSKGRNTQFFRTRLEESGALAGFIRNLDRGDLRRFLKLDAEIKYFIDQEKSSWAFRIFAGYGFVYGKSGDQKEYNLPFFKAYFGGGPYSMRAWAVRRLGLGSAIDYDTVGGIGADRFGDVKLEGNIEYRFSLGTVLGTKLESALFTDMGNIWGKAFDQNGQPMEVTEFRLSRLYHDLAIGAGTSLRFDFDFFLIRLDWAYKVKDPAFAAEPGKGWFRKLQLNSGQFQLGIGYPF